MKTYRAAVMVLLAGCTIELPPIESESITCGQDDDCPGALVCVSGGCRSLEDPCVERTGSGAAQPVADLNICTRTDGVTGICWRASCIPSVCGDGIVNPNPMPGDIPAEQCDDGELNSDEERAACRLDCRQFHCGDGVIDPGEQCDDGPANSDTEADACRLDCRLPICGDGAIDELEECDDGNQTSGDGCSSDCGSDETCGNGVLDLITGEQCDPSTGLSDEPNAECRTDCTYRRCGDGIIDTIVGESCDGTIDGLDIDCTDFGYYFPDGLVCTLCSFDRTYCQGECGDGEVNGFELCDGNPPTAQNCLSFGFDTGTLSCSNACAPDFSSCRRFGWGPIDAGTLDTLYGVWGSGPDDVYITGEQGAFLHYDGFQWTDLSRSLDNPGLHDVWGTGPDDVYAVGYNAVLHFDGDAWSTTNMGGTWLNGVWGSATDDVYVVGENGVMFHFDGSGWSDMSDSQLTTSALNAVWGSSASNVYVVGDDGTVLRYNGTDWSSVAISGLDSDDVYAVWGTSAANIYISGWGWRRHYDGTSPAWDEFDIPGWPVYTAHRGISGSGPNNIYIAGGGGSILRFGGRGWYPIESPYLTVQEFFDTWVDDSGAVYAVGNYGSIRYYDGKPVTWNEEPFYDNAWDPNGVWGSSATDVFVVGSYGDVKHLSGSTWNEMDSGSASLDDVWGTAWNNVIAVGNNGAIRRYNGSNWSSMSVINDPGERLFVVWGTSASNVYAGGRSETLLHYTGGASWSVVDLSSVTTNAEIHGIWGSSNTDMFFVGRSGLILHYGSSGWTDMSDYQVNSRWLRDAWGTDASNVWAVGFEGTILHYDGKQWVKIDHNLTVEHLYSIWGTSNNDIFVSGEGGTLLHYDGTTWQPYRSTNPVPLRGAWGIGTRYFFVGGDITTLDDGIILQVDRAL